MRAKSSHGASQVDIQVEVAADVPSFRAPQDSAGVQLALSLTGQNTSVAEPYAAEAGQFQAGGFAKVMWRPWQY